MWMLGSVLMGWKRNDGSASSPGLRVGSGKGIHSTVFTITQEVAGGTL